MYLICVAAGSVASYRHLAANPAVGASGGVFGLFGVLLVADRVHKPALTRNARNLTMQIGMLIGINLLIGFSLPGIDNAAHIGGLLAGAVLGFLLVPQGARLDSFWSRPSGDPVSPTGQAPDPVARTRPLRLVGVAALIGRHRGPRPHRPHHLRAAPVVARRRPASVVAEAARRCDSRRGGPGARDPRAAGASAPASSSGRSMNDARRGGAPGPSSRRSSPSQAATLPRSRSRSSTGPRSDDVGAPEAVAA